MTQLLLEPATPAERCRQIQEFVAAESDPATIKAVAEQNVPEFTFTFQPAAQDHVLEGEAGFRECFGKDGHYEHFTVRLRDGVTLHVATPSPGALETLNIGIGEPQHTRERKLEIIRRARRVFKTFERKSIAAHLGKEYAEFYQLREAVLSRLENAQTTMAEQAAHLLREIGERANEQEAARERCLEEQRSKLEEEHTIQRRALEQELEDARTDIQAERQKLEARAAELDDRDNTHARRKLRQDVKMELAKRSSEFTLSSGTTGKRWPVKLLCFSLMGFSALGLCAVIFGWTTNVSEWVNAARQLFFAGTFSATAVFYLRWENQWFQQHASEEFRLKRLDLDIDRASWIVETTLEYTHESREIPPELLKDLSRNLFAEPVSMGTVRHPVESLGDALLGASSQVRMKMGDAQVELDRKGIKKFEQSAMGDE